MRDLERLLPPARRAELRADVAGRRRWWPVATELLERGWTPRQVVRRVLAVQALPDDARSIGRLLAARAREVAAEPSPLERHRRDAARAAADEAARDRDAAAHAAALATANDVDEAIAALPATERAALEDAARAALPRLRVAANSRRLLAAEMRALYTSQRVATGRAGSSASTA